MATSKVFDRVKQNTLEKWTSGDFNDGALMAESAAMELLGQQLGLQTLDNLPSPSQNYRVLQGLKVTAFGGMKVNVGAGLGVQMWAGGAFAGLSRMMPLWLPADIQLDIDPADPLLDRFDRVVATFALYEAESEVRDVKDPITGNYLASAVNKRFRRTMRKGTPAEFTAGDCEITVRVGTPNAVPVPPAVVAGLQEITLGQVYVPAAAAAIVASNITDERVAARPVAEPGWSGVVMLGTQGAAFNAAALADQLYSQRAEGGLTLLTLFRNGVGNLTVQLAGAFDPAGGVSPDGLPLVQITPYGGTVLFRVITASVNAMDDGVVSFDVNLTNLGGLPADADIAITVRLRTPEGIALS